MADALGNLLKLPPMAAARHPSDSKPIIIVRGEPGYYPQVDHFGPDAFNARLGVSPAQREAMLSGSCFGWHVPAADPDRHPGAKEKA